MVFSLPEGRYLLMANQEDPVSERSTPPSLEELQGLVDERIPGTPLLEQPLWRSHTLGEAQPEALLAIDRNVQRQHGNVIAADVVAPRPQTTRTAPTPWVQLVAGAIGRRPVQRPAAGEARRPDLMAEISVNHGSVKHAISGEGIKQNRSAARLTLINTRCISRMRFS
jgi:hypothetical protein